MKQADLVLSDRVIASTLITNNAIKMENLITRGWKHALVSETRYATLLANEET